jgi:hypothetical protein
MVNVSTLNKLTKDGLMKICQDYNVNVPTTAKTKKDLVEFMMGVPNWPKPLDAILTEIETTSGSTKVKKSTTAKGNTSTVNSVVFVQMQKSIEEMNVKLAHVENELNLIKENKSSLPISMIPHNIPSPISPGRIDEMAFRIQRLESDFKAIKSNIPPPVLAVKKEPPHKSLHQMELEIAEAVPEEWTPIDDIHEFVENISDKELVDTLHYLYVIRVIDAKEGGSDLQIRLEDDTKLGIVKKRT